MSSSGRIYWREGTSSGGNPSILRLFYRSCRPAFLVLGFMAMTADEIKEMLQLEPLRMEGGFFRETYRSRWMVSPDYLPEGMRGMHSIGNAIYFLITPESSSRLHRVPGSDIFHFYIGDPVRMLQLLPDGTHQ